MTAETRVAQHYASAGIAERLLAALRAARGADIALTPDALAPLNHFHGRGVAATQELVAALTPHPGERLLDIGSGIGGPARWIAAKFGVHVTGVDLTAAFCEAAEALNRATGLADCVRILNGSALALPVPDGAFDRAYSQNVVMNIADKPLFYREACRALRPGGVFALANVCAGPAGPPHYPLMWAATAETSFLTPPEQSRAEMQAAGFEVVQFRDTTHDNLAVSTRYSQQLSGDRPPPLGMHVLMGADYVREVQANSARSTAEGRLSQIEVLLRKPG